MKSSKGSSKFKMFNVNQILQNHKVEKSVQFSEEEEEIPNYETHARKAARKAVKKEALKGCRETKIEVVIRHYFLSVTTDRFLLEISQVSGFCFY